MDEAIDLGAREQIAKLWTATREQGSALWGDDKTRDNGLRSTVREHDVRLDTVVGEHRELRAELRHYLDVERKETCHGKAALVEHLEAHTDITDEGVEVKVATITAEATKRSATVKEVAALAVAGLVLVGQVVQTTQSARLQLELAKIARDVAPASRYPGATP
jgi:hypothetical protein